MAMSAPMNSYPHSILDLSFECRGLVQKDLMSKSDPFVVVWLREKSGKQAGPAPFVEIGRTEIAKYGAMASLG